MLQKRKSFKYVQTYARYCYTRQHLKALMSVDSGMKFGLSKYITSDTIYWYHLMPRNIAALF